MAKLTKFHSGSSEGLELSILANPDREKTQIGKSVKCTLLPNVRYWFPIRATHNRAQKIYNKLVALNDNNIEPYLPIVRHIEYTNEDFKNPSQHIADQPLDKGLLFMRSTLNDFRALLQFQAMIPGMTPYYNHFSTNSYGTNDFLTIPERQMASFKIIVESGNENIIVNQEDMPKLITGDRVMVIGGPFAGVEGTIMKYKHQKRVFVELQGVGTYATAYVPGAWVRKIEA